MNFSTNAVVIIVGDDAHEGYLKVAKKHAKKEEEKKKEEKKTPKRKSSGYGHSGFHPMSYQASAMMQPLGQVPYWQSQPPPGAAAMGSAMTPRIPKSHLRCLNCGEFGHFAKECSRSSAASK